MECKSRAVALIGCVIVVGTGACFGQSIVNIGIAPGATQSRAAAVNGDGSVVAVQATAPGQLSRAHLWTQRGGFEDVGLPVGVLVSGMSGDGSKVVVMTVGPSDLGFSWTATGDVEYLPYDF